MKACKNCKHSPTEHYGACCTNKGEITDKWCNWVNIKTGRMCECRQYK